jgi:histidinol-phosphatase
MSNSPFLETAIAAATAGEAVIRRYYQGQFDVELKADQSPVTIADVETEHAIKAVSLAAFPDHGFFGEETGQINPDAEYNWLIDPIDGTKSFVRHYPLFSTQIALMHRSELILGVSNAPMFGELAYAERGQGAYLNDEPIRVSAVDELGEAILSLGNIEGLVGGPRWDRLGGLVQSVNRTRGYGDFYHYHLLAAGKLDIVVESDLNILDIAALSVIVTEAGGCFTDLDGGSLDLATTSALACNSERLHQCVLGLLCD